MNKKFSARIKEYLDTECSDYGLQYDYKWCEDTECCEVKITTDHNDNIKNLNFRYDDDKDDLSIELSEDSFYVTREFDWSVKYFWMLVSPALFPNN